MSFVQDEATFATALSTSFMFPSNQSLHGMSSFNQFVQDMGLDQHSPNNDPTPPTTQPSQQYSGILSQDTSAFPIIPQYESMGNNTNDASSYGQLQGFPPMRAFIPVDDRSSCINQRPQQESLPHPPQRRQSQPSQQTHQMVPSHSQAFMNIATTTTSNSSQSLSPESVMGFGWTSLDPNESFKRYRVLRGISSGGYATKPPRMLIMPGHCFTPVVLEIIGAELEELCLPEWNEAELEDKRRIIRIERHQVSDTIVAKFSIVGSAIDNPKTLPAAPGVDVVEVSCLVCTTRKGDEGEEEEEEEENVDAISSNSPIYKYDDNTSSDEAITKRFYITSVEVIKVVELLIGTELSDAHERRRERGRIRSNLVPFWSKKSISSRLSNKEVRQSPLTSPAVDFRAELATRIMRYEVRKPRGFDKEVRILKWERLVAALRRALQSYYVEVEIDFKK